MGESAPDPLAVGQRIVAILEAGLRTATYKLATLSALVDHAIENLPTKPDGELLVPIPALAERVVELYWPQLRPYDGTLVLSQISGGRRAAIVAAVATLRRDTGASHTQLSLNVARSRSPRRYEETIAQVAQVLARYPLRLLQNVGSTHDPFLYDDSWLSESVSLARRREHGDAIVLRPGIAHALARLSGLLKPALEIMWVDDVRRMNREHFEERGDDLAAHLFGRDRIPLAPVRGAFRKAFGPRCFYCGRTLGGDSPVDHVLPWSRVGIDGLANLVLACGRCNSEKSGALPSVHLVEQVLERDRVTLEQIADQIQWPTQFDRVRAAARGLYLGQPKGTVTWAGPRSTVLLDLADSSDWLRVELDWDASAGDLRSP